MSNGTSANIGIATQARQPSRIERLNEKLQGNIVLARDIISAVETLSSALGGDRPMLEMEKDEQPSRPGALGAVEDTAELLDKVLDLLRARIQTLASDIRGD